MAKKLFFISAGVFVLLCIILAIFKFFPQKGEDISQKAEYTPSIDESQKDESAPAVSSGKVKKLIDGQVHGLTLTADSGKLLYFQNGKVLAMEFSGSTKDSIGAYPFNNVSSFIWSPTKKRAIVKTDAGFFIYDLDTDQAAKMKEGVDVAAWDEKGDQLVYKYFDKATGTRSINVSDISGSDWKEVVKTPYKKVDFQVNPATGEIGYYPSPDSFTLGQFNGLTLQSNAERKIFESKYGADFLWSPDGKKLLVSFVVEKGGKRMEIGVANQSGAEYKTLDFPTSVKKCVWAKDNVTLYCAMMSGSTESTVLPNDWSEKKLQTADTFWKIDTSTGKKQRLLQVQELSEALDAENLLVDPGEKKLYFIERQSGALYTIDL